LSYNIFDAAMKAMKSNLYKVPVQNWGRNTLLEVLTFNKGPVVMERQMSKHLDDVTSMRAN
jgi:hypothetical protein